MNRIIILITALIFLNQCSFNENSRIWKDKENKLETQKNIKKVFVEDKKISAVIKIIILFTQISIQSFFSL